MSEQNHFDYPIINQNPILQTPSIRTHDHEVPSPLLPLNSNAKNNHQPERLGLAPEMDFSGQIITPKEVYETMLSDIHVKSPLQNECERLGIRYPKSGTLQRLRNILLNCWYPSLEGETQKPTNESAALTTTSADCSPLPQTPLRSHTGDPYVPQATEGLLPAFSYVPPVSALTSQQNPQITKEITEPTSDKNPIGIPQQFDLESAAENELVAKFEVHGASADDILGFDDENDADDLDEELDEDLLGLDLDSPETFRKYQAQVRISAAKRAEGNRREGGLKTQRAMVRNWKAFTTKYMKSRAIKDDIVDEHSLLLFIEYSAERPKQNRRGQDIPGTFIGASQLKKLFFGALCIRKEQEAADNTLASRRRATSVGVWDAVKSRMDEALQRTRNGLMPNEDAPDIVANTFLAEITPEEIDEVGRAFLSHRELRCAINGHLSWTIQHATGGRGDDLRSFKLAELQPWQFLHPNQQTQISTVLILQGEEKAGKRGMKTTVNPVYSSLIAHRKPEKCPLGALAFLFHYLYDVKDLATIEKIDWSLNKSWRQIRLLHSSKAYTVSYSAASLYNLYVKAFNKASLNSRLKLHLARHILGYLQEQLGVDSRETSKLGWNRGDTYSDVYSPAIPKTAVLGCHGYKEHENYDPLWRHVRVPEAFLQLVCPMAEEVLEDVRGGDNLRGTTGHWDMIISLRPFLFQCGAAIFKTCPDSPIFKLPALADPDVRNWMKTTFQQDLSLLQANAGDPVDLQRLQNQILQSALLELRAIVNQQSIQIRKLISMIERRTSVLSPAKGYSVKSYFANAYNAARSLLPLPQQISDLSTIPMDVCTTPKARTPSQLDPPINEDYDIENVDGIYRGPNSQFLACVSDSPKGSNSPPPRTQVDLVLPPPSSFSDPSQPSFLWPPVLGQQGVSWMTIFKLVKRPNELWETWKPSQTLDQYETVEALWNLFHEGEPLLSCDGVKSGMKPPLRLVEQYFSASWRPGAGPRKTWERFREIPDWIDSESSSRHVPPTSIIEELEKMRGTKPRKGLNVLMKEVMGMRKRRREKERQEEDERANDTAHSSTSSPSLLLSEPGDSLQDPPTKKRRAQPIDPRRQRKTRVVVV